MLLPSILKDCKVLWFSTASQIKVTSSSIRLQSFISKQRIAIYYVIQLKEQEDAFKPSAIFEIRIPWQCDNDKTSILVDSFKKEQIKEDATI